jgi:DNA polymerase III subunit epsilon
LVAPDSRVWFGAADFASATTVPDGDHAIGPVPSEFSLRPLHAQVALLSGCAPLASLRAHAVGTSALWTPDEGVFGAGWAMFAERHAGALAAGEGAPRARLLRLAAHLLASRPFDRAAEPEAVEDPQAPDWDPERVARHLERAAAQAYLLFRRSRWLRLFFDSDVTYREPGSARTRRLHLRAGQLAAAVDDADERRPALAVAASGAFDRATYDRLRILTTELRRILRDGGYVRMRPSRP